MKARITKEGLLIPREVAERALPGSDEVEIFEEPGRLLVVPANSLRDKEESIDKEDPIFSLGEDPVKDSGVADASASHDRYLYG